MANGLVIYFDGPDGAGKTTQLHLVAENLRQEGYTVHNTRTLGGTPIGESLRQAALSQYERPVETDLHIALASSYALAAEVLARRESGEVILIDRSPLSMVAYQVYGDGLDEQQGFLAADQIMELIKPDLTIVYMASDETLQTRRKQRIHDDGDYFENKSLDYHKRVAEGFEKASEHFKAVLVGANGEAEEVHQDTMKYLRPLLERS